MARLFNGTTDKAIFSGVTASNWPLTFSAWAYPTAAQVGNLLSLSRSTNTNPINSLAISATPVAQCFARNALAGLSTATGTVTLTLNKWWHIAGTIAAAGIATVYTNGVDKQSGATIGNHMDTVDNTTIGFQRRTTDNAFFPGRIAEACIWSVVLTDAEIAALAIGRHCKSVRPKSIIGYWPLYGLASPEPDLSGIVQSMTLAGTAQATHSPTSLFTPRHPEIIITGAVASHPRSQAYVYG